MDVKGKGKQHQQNESQHGDDDEVIHLEIDDVSTWLKSNEDDDTNDNDTSTELISTPDRKTNPSRSVDELLKTSPRSPLYCERKKGDIPLPKAPVFVIDDSDDDEQDTKLSSSNTSKPNILRDDLDLDASVAAIFKPKKGGTKRKMKSDVAKPTMMECPICSRMFLKEKIEIHASDCTGAYSESDEEEEKEAHGKRKKTMASAIAKSEAIRKKKFKNVEQVPINYYSQSEEMVGTDGGDFASNSAGLQWESAGQTRFA